MKNGLVLIVLGICCCFAVTGKVEASGESSAYSSEFISHLVQCKKYREETPMIMFDVPFTPTVVIDGWKNGKCVYSNFVKEQPEKSKRTCYFTKAQLQEILEASKKDPNQKETYKGNGMSYTSDPLSVVFTKFLNDSSTCKLE